jgi:hypothetical protein
MNATQPTLPARISEYINSHFREDFLFQYKTMSKVGNKRCYAIDISKDEHIYHLFFDENGRLVKKLVEESFPADDHIDPRMGDSPE